MPDRTLAGCRILVVEDEFMLADVLQTELEDVGVIVLGPAPSVDSALALLANDAPLDGAVLDVNIGGKTSYPVADELLRRKIPFVFTTGYDRHAIPERYRHIAQCQKPTEVAAILDAIGQQIRK